MCLPLPRHPLAAFNATTTDSVAEEASCRVLVERPAVAVCRNHGRPPLDVESAMRKIDRHTPASARSHFELNRLCRRYIPHQRRGARCLDGDSGPSQVQLVGDTGRQKVFLVEDNPGKTPNGPERRGVRPGCRVVGVDACAGIDAYRARNAVWIEAGFSSASRRPRGTHAAADP